MVEDNNIQFIGSCAICGRDLKGTDDFYYDDSHNVLICRYGYVCKEEK